MRDIQRRFGLLTVIAWLWIGNAIAQPDTSQTSDPSSWTTGRFRWEVHPPFLQVNSDRLPESTEHPWVAIKDPSIVRFEGRWHLFCTLRKRKKGNGRIRIGYLSFEDFATAETSRWSVLDLTMEYHGAPQIFFFEPQQTWYLIYQATDSNRGLKYGPCYSTNKDITSPEDWTKPQPLYVVPEGQKAGLDYWVICDDRKAHLFFTTLDGRMWRAATELKDFPNRGWTSPQLALQADIFEASHTYALEGRNQFLTIVEAQRGKRRYFKGFIANQLDGHWKPIADSEDTPLVSPENVVNQTSSWAGSYSHGEFLRSGYDQRLLLSPDNVQLLFQGASDQQYQNNDYGSIPWRLGILTAR